MYFENSFYLGLADGQRVTLPLHMANRHGLIAGASGTGKTITMKVMAESFSDAGVPVFLCDVKGDVSGLAQAGEQNPGMEKRIDKFGIHSEFTYKPYPVTFWDIYGEQGHPIRATVSDIGPELLARLLDLTPAQEGVLNIVFEIADDHDLLLSDLKDLHAMLDYVSDHRKELTTTYGNVSSASLGAILRALIPLENQGGDLFFGEPMLDIKDWMRKDENGKGMINLLHCVKLVRNPKLYGIFLLWMMAELFERLPEVGDMDKPRLVFFFDEAHLLFEDAPKVLVQKIEQMVKLIRSKGVGIYFVTQSPKDIPDAVLAQLSNRVQHALRAYTPAEQKAVKAAVQSMRPNPAFNAAEVLMELGVGQALVSLLDDEGVPTIVQNTAIICPQSLMAPADPAIIAAAIRDDGMEKYDETIDLDSAYEELQEMAQKEAEEAQLAAEREALEKEKAALEKEKQKLAVQEAKRKQKEEEKKQREKEKREEAERKKAQRRREKIETKLINTGAQIVKRGIMKTLKW